jgi:NTE family protein
LVKRKIGLALGSGAARGLAHIGVLEVLQEQEIPVDMVAGTSAGAIIGALYARGRDIKEIKSTAMELKAPKLISLVDPSVPRSGLIMGRNVSRLLSSYFKGDVQFEQLMLPFACVATDIETGEEIVFDHGSVLEAIRASISIPGVFSVVRWKGRYLVDGALVNPIPVDVLARMGADFVIAVNVIPEASIEARKAARGRKDTLGTAQTIKQLSSLAERLVSEKADTLKESKIVAEMAALVRRLTTQGDRVLGTPQMIQKVSSELRELTEQGIGKLGKAGPVHKLSALMHQLAIEQEKRLKEPSIVNVLLQSLNISAYSLVRTSLAAADITISARVGHIGIADFTKGRECIEEGRIAASEAIPEIKRQLAID